MRTDDILSQIDNTLEDWAVSGDAMRSRPAREPNAPHVSIMNEAGEWQEIEGVTSVEFHIEPPAIDADFIQSLQQLQEHLARTHAERVRQAQAFLDAFKQIFEQTVAPAVQEAARNAAKGLASVKRAADCDVHCGPPPPPRDRPAWQSPYGPARQRR